MPIRTMQINLQMEKDMGLFLDHWSENPLDFFSGENPLDCTYFPKCKYPLGYDLKICLENRS